MDQGQNCLGERALNYSVNEALNGGLLVINRCNQKPQVLKTHCHCCSFMYPLSIKGVKVEEFRSIMLNSILWILEVNSFRYVFEFLMACEFEIQSSEDIVDNTNVWSCLLEKL